MSKAINEILVEALLEGERMFGTMKKTSLKDLRDHSVREKSKVLTGDEHFLNLEETTYIG